jgi:Domain of unknown function (DUF4431)
MSRESGMCRPQRTPYRRRAARDRAFLRRRRSSRDRTDPHHAISDLSFGAGQEDNVKPTRKLHVYANDTAMHRKLQAFVGKGVRVTGEVFAAHTAHHHAPIVMDVKRVETP